MRLTNKVALLTGAASGIGKGVARRFAAADATLWLTDRDVEMGEATAHAIRQDFGVNVHFLQVDVSKRDSMEAAIRSALAQSGGIDILVNNAWGLRPGAHGFGPVESQDDEDVDWAMRMAPRAALWAMPMVFPGMRARAWGRIINMCSLNGVNAHPFSVDYNMAKEALRTLTRTAAREWAVHGICCNAICPAAATEAYQRFAAAQPDNAAAMLSLNPMGRMGDPESDIGSVALFLASEDCRYLTGNTLYADGGSHINGLPWNPQASKRA